MCARFLEKILLTSCFYCSIQAYSLCTRHIPLEIVHFSLKKLTQLSRPDHILYLMTALEQILQQTSTWVPQPDDFVFLLTVLTQLAYALAEGVTQSAGRTTGVPLPEAEVGEKQDTGGPGEDDDVADLPVFGKDTTGATASGETKDDVDLAKTTSRNWSKPSKTQNRKSTSGNRSRARKQLIQDAKAAASSSMSSASSPVVPLSLILARVVAVLRIFTQVFLRDFTARRHPAAPLNIPPTPSAAAASSFSAASPVPTLSAAARRQYQSIFAQSETMGPSDGKRFPCLCAVNVSLFTQLVLADLQRKTAPNTLQLLDSCIERVRKWLAAHHIRPSTSITSPSRLLLLPKIMPSTEAVSAHLLARSVAECLSQLQWILQQDADTSSVSCVCAAYVDRWSEPVPRTPWHMATVTGNEPLCDLLRQSVVLRRLQGAPAVEPPTPHLSQASASTVLLPAPVPKPSIINSSASSVKKSASVAEVPSKPSIGNSSSASSTESSSSVAAAGAPSPVQYNQPTAALPPRMTPARAMPKSNLPTDTTVQLDGDETEPEDEEVPQVNTVKREAVIEAKIEAKAGTEIGDYDYEEEEDVQPVIMIPKGSDRRAPVFINLIDSETEPED